MLTDANTMLSADNNIIPVNMFYIYFFETSHNHKKPYFKYHK
jgi:hypothetical protein